MNTYKSKRNVSPLAKLIGVAITAIVALPIASAVVALGVLLQGWAIHLLWNWFIPPIFGLTGLTIGQSIGLSLVVGIFTSSPSTARDEDRSASAFREVANPFIYVLLGWIVQMIIF